MKKSLVLVLALMVALFLTACTATETAAPQEGPPVGSSTSSEPQVAFTEAPEAAEDNFSKILAPMAQLEPDGNVTTSYYQLVSKEDETFYKVQPVDEEAFLIPIDSVALYPADSAEQTVEKLTLTMEDGDILTQYRLHILFEAVPAEDIPAGQ